MALHRADWARFVLEVVRLLFAMVAGAGGGSLVN